MPYKEGSGSEIGEQNSLSKTETTVEKLAKEHKEDIAKIEQLPLQGDQLAQIILVLLGEQPAVDIFVYPENSPEVIKKTLQDAGLLFKVKMYRDRRGKECEVLFIAQKIENAEQLLNISPDEGKRTEHEKYAQLMGFPQTAIDAFLGRTSVQNEDTSDPSLVVDIKYSRLHAKEEKEFMHRRSMLIRQYAPKLYEQIINAGK